MKEKVISAVPGLTNCFVAGGAITSLYTNKPINDWDIYPKSMQAREDAIMWAYESGYFNAHASDRALTFAKGEETQIQIMIFDTFETTQKIFDLFDFTVCMGAFDLDAQKFTLHENFLIHCSQRFLSFNPNTRFPYASAWRVRKYEEKGYTIGKMEYFKILMACQRMPINSWVELKSQIGGVYGEAMEIPEDEPYSFERALEVISTMKPSEENNGYATAEEAIACTSGREILYIPQTVKDVLFSLTANRYWAKIYDDEWVCIKVKPLNGKLVTLEEIYPGLTFYKKVHVNDDGTFQSMYKGSFKYTAGCYVDSPSPYIYSYDSVERAKQHYDYHRTKKHAILTLVADSPNDIILETNLSQPKLKRCKVVAAEIID